MSKQPKVGAQIDISKNPKVIESPASYKNIPISWQLSHVDDESRWGINVFKSHFIFSITDELLNELPNSSNEIYDTLSKLNGKKFNSIDGFLNKLHIGCNYEITAIEQKIIVKHLRENIFWIDFYPKLRHFESQTWLELEKELFGAKSKTKHHSVSVSKIIPEARKRLAHLKLDDIDELFSIRLTGEQRIWGIRHFSYLRILWFDLEHEICPSSKN